MQAINRTGNQHTHCFVVMPDHVHWILEVRGHGALADIVQECKSISAHRINRVMSWRGKFWQSGYHDHAIRNDESLLEVARYVISNPLRARLCERLEEYSHWDAEWV